MAETGTETGAGGDSHWVRWHEAYQDEASPLSVRLRLVQTAVRTAIDSAPEGPIRIVSLCAGQGRDVIDVVAAHPRRLDVAALLVDLDADLVAFARARAAEVGVSEQVTIVEGDAAQCRLYADAVPAQDVLVCGVFGNISAADVTNTIGAMTSFCAPGASVIWTRHRRPPDATPALRSTFAEAGFEEVSFEAPEGYVLSVGHHRFTGQPRAFEPEAVLFSFVGDGSRPA